MKLLKKWVREITEWVRKQGRKESGFAHFIQFLYHTLSSSFIQAFISILGTVIIALMTAVNYYGVWLYISVAMFVILTMLSALASDHIHKKTRDTIVFQEALRELSKCSKAIAVALQKCAQNLKDSTTTKQRQQILKSSNIDFQSAAFAVCKSLRDCLSQKNEKDDVYVTVFQKEIKDGSAYCRMIAYSEEYEVSGYKTRYEILPEHRNQFGNVEYHTYVFASEIQDITTFHNKELVDEAFCHHKLRKEREKLIQQYICIPISPANLGVTFLLQVDTNELGFWGHTKESVDEFAKNTIYPYAQLLLLIYEQGRVIHQLTVK